MGFSSFDSPCAFKVDHLPCADPLPLWDKGEILMEDDLELSEFHLVLHIEDIVQHCNGNTEQCCHDGPIFDKDPIILDKIKDSEEDEGHMLNILNNFLSRNQDDKEVIQEDGEGSY